MAEELKKAKPGAGKKEKYELLMEQMRHLTDSKADVIANLSNCIAALHETMGFLWTGVYYVKENEGKEELMLGPFQGPVACTRIGYGKGVCGAAWLQREPILVDDVEKFPGHIACSSRSRSEIVLPLFRENRVFMVLDADSENISNFDQVDLFYLKQIARLIEDLH